MCRLSETKKGTRFTRDGFKKYIQTSLSDHVKYDENFANHLFRCFFLQTRDEGGGSGVCVLKSSTSSSSSSEVSLRRFVAAYCHIEHASRALTRKSSSSSGNSSGEGSVEARWYAILFSVLDMDFDGKILKTNICDFVNSLILIDDIKVLFSDSSGSSNNLIIVDDLNIRFNDMVDEFFMLSTSSVTFEFMNEAEFAGIAEKRLSALPLKLHFIFMRLVGYAMLSGSVSDTPQTLQPPPPPPPTTAAAQIQTDTSFDGPTALPPLPSKTKGKTKSKVTSVQPQQHQQQQHHKKHQYTTDEDIESRMPDLSSGNDYRYGGGAAFATTVNTIAREEDGNDTIKRQQRKHKNGREEVTSSDNEGGNNGGNIGAGDDDDGTDPKKSKKKKKKKKIIAKQEHRKPTKPLPPTPPQYQHYQQQQQLSTKSLPSKFSGSTQQIALSKTMVSVAPRDVSAYYLTSPTMTPATTSSSGDFGLNNSSSNTPSIAAATTTTATNNNNNSNNNNTSSSTKNSTNDDMSADIGSETGTDTHGVVGGISSTGASLEEGEIGGGSGSSNALGPRGRLPSVPRAAQPGLNPLGPSKSCHFAKMPFSSTSSSSSDFNIFGCDEDGDEKGNKYLKEFMDKGGNGANTSASASHPHKQPPKASTLRLRSSNPGAFTVKKDPLAVSLSALPRYPPLLFPSVSSSRQKLPLNVSVQQQPQTQQQQQPQPPPSQMQSQPQGTQNVLQKSLRANDYHNHHRNASTSATAATTMDPSRYATPPYQPPGRKAEDLFVTCMLSMENGEYLKGAALAQQGLVALPDNAEPRCRASLASYYVALRILNTLQCLHRDAGTVPGDPSWQAMLAGWLAALPMHREHKEACLLISSLYSEAAARATRTLVPECAPLAERFAPKGVPGLVARCRKCGAKCNAAFPRCAVCGTQVLYCCLTLRPIEGKGTPYFKCAFCKATFEASALENRLDCPVCKRVSLVVTED